MNRPVPRLQDRTLSSPRDRISATRVALIASSVLLCVVLNYSYAEIESHSFSHLGLIYNPPAVGYVLLGYLLAIAPAFWMPITLERPSQIVLWWLYVAIVIPSMFLPFHILSLPSHETALLPLSYFGCFLLICVSVRYMPEIKPPSFHLNSDALCMWLAFFVIVMCVVISTKEGFHVSLSLEDVYTRRLESRDSVVGGSLRSYALAGLRWSIAPILIAQGIIRKKPLWMAAGVLGAIYSFSFSGEKMTIFLPFYLLGLSLLVVRFRRHFGMMYLLGFTAVILMGIYEHYCMNSEYISLHISRRQLFSPALLNVYYYDFFSQHGFTWFADSLLQWFIDSPYELRPGPLIGSTYFGNAENNCVANFWAVGFSEIGFAGMVFYSLILAFLLKFLDTLGKTGHFSLTCLVAGLMSLSWGSSGLFTSILSSGIAIDFALLCLLQKESPNSAHQLVGLRPVASVRGELSTK